MPYVAGWGATMYQGPQSNVLHHAQVPIIPLEKCARNYKSYFPNQLFDKRVICAGYGGRDTCQGDSGGPLMIQQVFFVYKLNAHFSRKYFKMIRKWQMEKEFSMF